MLKHLIGDAFSNCGKNPMKFSCWIIDSSHTRSMGISFNKLLFNPEWVKKKLEKTGCLVIDERNPLHVGHVGELSFFDKDLNRTIKTLTSNSTKHFALRIIEDQDIAV